MKRREALARMMLIAAMSAPFAVAAQTGKRRKPARIGFLPLVVHSGPRPFHWGAAIPPLRRVETGWAPGCVLY